MFRRYTRMIYSSFRAEHDRDMWAAIVGAAVDTMDYQKKIDPHIC